MLTKAVTVLVSLVAIGFAGASLLEHGAFDPATYSSSSSTSHSCCRLDSNATPDSFTAKGNLSPLVTAQSMGALDCCETEQSPKGLTALGAASCTQEARQATDSADAIAWE